MIAVLIVAVSLGLVRLRLQYLDREAASARLRHKQRLIRALGPASAPQQLELEQLR
jgi:hypothetical protein